MKNNDIIIQAYVISFVHAKTIKEQNEITKKAKSNLNDQEFDRFLDLALKEIETRLFKLNPHLYSFLN